MTQHDERQETRTLGAALPAYRWLATLFAVLIVVQAYLGSSGVFKAEEWMISGHGHLANAMFPMIAIQTVLAWILYTKKAISVKEVGLNAVLVLLTITQIGLGYSTRSGENYGDIVSLHIPNGVLLMGLSAAIAALAWRIGAQHPADEAYG